MSAGVSDQRMKGQGNQVSNGPKEQLGDGGSGNEEFEPWRTQQQQQNSATHSNYGASVPISSGTDLQYGMNTAGYYGSGGTYPYQAYGVGDGTWSNGTDPMTFLSGYPHDSYSMDAMFNPSTTFSTATAAAAAAPFSQHSAASFNYFHSNGGDYSTWGGSTAQLGAAPQQQQQQRKYDDYYRSPADPQSQPMYAVATAQQQSQVMSADSLKAVEQAMQNLVVDAKDVLGTSVSLGGGMVGIGSMGSMGNMGSALASTTSSAKKTTWASIASQPAKPQLSAPNQGLKKKGPGMPPGPIVPGKHNIDIGTWGSSSSSSKTPPQSIPPPPTQLPPVPQLPQAPSPQHPPINNNPPLMANVAAPPPTMHQQQQAQSVATAQAAAACAAAVAAAQNKGIVGGGLHGLGMAQGQGGLGGRGVGGGGGWNGPPVNRPPPSQQQQQQQSRSSGSNIAPQLTMPQSSYQQHHQSMMQQPPQQQQQHHHHHQHQQQQLQQQQLQQQQQQHNISGGGGSFMQGGGMAGIPVLMSAQQATTVAGSGMLHPVLDELRESSSKRILNADDTTFLNFGKNNYNPGEFDLTAPNARFFVIKSYSEDDIHRSIKYEIWCSTEHGNKRLDQAYREREHHGTVLLFFSVNGSGHFCGMAQMVSAVDYNSNSSVWSQDKWKGQFKVRWVYVKDVPNVQLRHIRLENNENKPVTNSRDTQEVPHAKGLQVLRIMHSFRHSTSIFDDFIHYEKRQEEEDSRKVPEHLPPPKDHLHRGGDRDHRGGDRDHHRDRDNRGDRGDRDHQQNRDNRDNRDGGHRGGGGGGGGGGRHHQDRDRDNRNDHNDGGNGRDGGGRRDGGGWGRSHPGGDQHDGRGGNDGRGERGVPSAMGHHNSQHNKDRADRENRGRSGRGNQRN